MLKLSTSGDAARRLKTSRAPFSSEYLSKIAGDKRKTKRSMEGTGARVVFLAPAVVEIFGYENLETQHRSLSTNLCALEFDEDDESSKLENGMSFSEWQSAMIAQRPVPTPRYGKFNALDRTPFNAEIVVPIESYNAFKMRCWVELHPATQTQTHIDASY